MAGNGYIHLPEDDDVDKTKSHPYAYKVPLQNRLVELVRSGSLAALAGMQGYTLFLVAAHKTVTKKHSGIWLKFRSELTVEAVFLPVFTLLMLSSLYLASTSKSTFPRRLVASLTNLTALLSALFFTYRDLYPLATYALSPVDPAYLPTGLAWARMSLLAFVGYLLPLLQERIYYPIDPLNPSPKPHPRQYAPILSRMFFNYMDSTLFMAWKNPQISHEDLAPAPDTEKASFLFAEIIPDLDPIERKRRGLKRRNMLTLVIGKFWRMYLTMALMMILKAVFEFASPIALNSLLGSLQPHSEPGYFRSWVWVVLLAVGPLSSSLAMRYYQVLGTTNLVRLECIFTELLFTHSLRIKMQDGGSTSEKDSSATAIDTPAIQIEGGDSLVKGQDIIEEANLEQMHPQDAESSSSSDGDKTKTDVQVQQASAAPSVIVPGEDKDKKEASIVGRINTLMTSDIDNVLEAREILEVILYGPLQIILGTFFLYRILSWSAFVGMACNLITLPIPGYLAGMLNAVQKTLMKKTDIRVQAITEVLQTLKMVKLFAWEAKVKEQISEKREDEMKQIWKRSLIGCGVGTVNWLLPIITMVACYGCYTGIQGQPLTAAKVFSSITVFDMIRHQMYMVSSQMQALIGAKVSLERLDNFFNDTEMLDKFEKPEVEITPAQEAQGVFFRNATFYWSSAKKRVAGQRQFRLQLDDVKFPEKKISIISGPTGCGKSSTLMALLGELAFEPSSLDSAFSLPRAGGVSYAAQDSWVMADTVKNNITFGTEYDEERYRMVIRQCALERDLELFAAGDETELGDKGLNASGGQKARISLARAFYAKSAIILLDDVLSALDVHTTQYIIDNLFKGPLAADRTIILVTHHVTLVKPVADWIVNLSINGNVASQGPVDKTEYIPTPSEEPQGSGAETPAEELGAEAAGEKKDADKKDGTEGKLVIAEEKGTGRVSRSTLWNYFAMAGGPVFWILYYLDIIAGEFLFAYCNYFLGLWSKAYEEASDPSEVRIGWWMGIYVALMVLQVLSYDSSSLMWTFGSLKAARRLHAALVDKVLGANMRFLDQTPVGRLIGRFTKDMKSVDTGLQRMFQGLSEIIVTLAMKFVLLIWLVPTFAPFALFVGALGMALGEFYIKAQLSVKREMSNSKTPLYTHFSAASNGLVSIRAYGAEERFKEQLGDKADAYTGTATIFYDLNRWIGIRIDFLGAMFASVLAGFLVYGSNKLDVFVLGFAINQAISFADIILASVRVMNDFEVQANGIERINDYLIIDQEPAATEKGKPPASWPTDGKIVMEGLSARYYAGGPTVLKDISITVESGERVGIVGRTGSGKSTMTLALLRMIPTEGTIRISDLDTSKINLDSLRSEVTIIPQDPVLLAGSLRYNLDPFDTADDLTLNQSLDISGLTSARLQGTAGSATPMAITLDTSITSGGGNLSQGQRQLVSLARALCRGSKVMILDEATASVDFATDTLVQKAIRELQGITILTVAHRLSTVMDYDKILVLDAGAVIEYDTPYNLLQIQDGVLRGMVDKASNKDELERLAKPPKA